MNVRIANAPISYGVFGDIDLGVAGVDRMLDDLVAVGYSGTELGPPHLFGSPQEANERLRARGLECAGAYIPFHFVDSQEVFDAEWQSMQQTIKSLIACGAEIAVVADEGSDVLLANPRHHQSLGLGEDQWKLFFKRLNAVSREIRDNGLRVSFHPHISTFVESPVEIRRVLSNSDVELTFDTGHVLLGGGDVVACTREWIDRISHVHIKDVNPEVMERAIAEQRTDFNEWWADVSVPLGSGAVAFAGFLDVLHASNYDGWLVVEQDRAPANESTWNQILADQDHNFRWLQQAVHRSGSNAAPDASGV